MLLYVLMLLSPANSLAVEGQGSIRGSTITQSWMIGAISPSYVMRWFRAHFITSQTIGLLLVSCQHVLSIKTLTNIFNLLVSIFHNFKFIPNVKVLGKFNRLLESLQLVNNNLLGGGLQ